MAINNADQLLILGKMGLTYIVDLKLVLKIILHLRKRKF